MREKEIAVAFCGGCFIMKAKYGEGEPYGRFYKKGDPQCFYQASE